MAAGLPRGSFWQQLPCWLEASPGATKAGEQQPLLQQGGLGAAVVTAGLPRGGTCSSFAARSQPWHTRVGYEQSCAQQVWLGAVLCTPGLARSSQEHTKYG